MQKRVSFHEIFVYTVRTIITNRKHTSLGTYITKISTVETVTEFHDRVVIDITFLRDRFGMNLANLKSGLFVR